MESIDPHVAETYRVGVLDLQFVRSHFPALETPWALFDNAGGSVPARQVIERVRTHMERVPVQLGASYPMSQDASAAVEEGRRAAELLVGANPGELVFGPASTSLAILLARALRPLWNDGDEIIVTSLDHEANVGPWRALEKTGIVVRTWDFRVEDAKLHLEDLEPLLNERTRLVAFTHSSNVVGTIHDVASMTRRIREAGALSCVDGVAFAPHRRVDVKALGCDFYLASLYKVYGPHIGILYGRRELLLEARSQNHFFVSESEVPYKLEPGNCAYELAAGVSGIIDYFRALDEHHGGDGGEGALERAFDLIAKHESALCEPLVSFLNEHPHTKIIGREDADSAGRVPTVAFVVEGRDSEEITRGLDERSIAARYGHFYAYHAIERMGYQERNGIVRVSMLHYNSPEEVSRCVEALKEIL